MNLENPQSPAHEATVVSEDLPLNREQSEALTGAEGFGHYTQMVWANTRY